MTATYIVCPGDLVTGGPELLHQLAGALRMGGRDAYIVYHPFHRVFETPATYTKYGVAVAPRSAIAPGAAVVLPEVYIAHTCDFAGNRVFLWWLSVDNFRASLGSARMSRLLPAALHPLAKALAKRFGWLRKAVGLAGRHGGIDMMSGVHMHLHQSEFARQYLEANGLGPTAPLGDYVNDDYLALVADPPTVARENLVTFNPMKGVERTAAIVAELAAQKIEAVPVPIRGYTRDEVRDLLSRAKLYIDFGNHPGKDRIPREAAATGACVIVNRRGSAGNDIDVPLPADYKIDDEVAGFEVEAARKIAAVLADFDTHHHRLAGYRARIAAEHDEFVRQSLSLFP